MMRVRLSSKIHRSILLVGLVIAVAGGSIAMAQSSTTGAISGKVTDPTGAVVPGAKITATNLDTGQTRTTTTENNGNYQVQLLNPGTYSVTVEKSGFQTAKQTPIAVNLTSTSEVNLKMTVGQASQTVEVNAEAPLIEPENPNLTTTVNQAAIDNQPNPGGDVTFLAQISAGAVTAQSAGGTAGLNFNGLPNSSIGWTMDGMDDNDPFLNVNNAGVSDMTLGQNAIGEVSVSTNAYSADQGRFSAANVNYLSKGGGNGFHGDLQYQWNGRVLNAYDFFTKATPLAAGQSLPNKPFDNVNNWAGGVGGPIIKNKLFFYFDSEGVRIALPLVKTGTLPTPAYLAYAQQELALGGCDTSTSLAVTQAVAPAGYPAAGSNCVDPQATAGVANGKSNYEKYLPPETGANANGINEAPFMAQIASLFDGPQGTTAVGTYGGRLITAGTAKVAGCNILPNGNVDAAFNPQLAYTTAAPAGGSGSVTNSNPIPADLGCENNVIFNTSNHTPETLTSLRMDWNINQNNTMWWRYFYDNGIQATSTSIINPILNATSAQPYDEGWFDYTHVFTPSLTNDFNPTFFWYSNIFTFGNGGISNEPQVLGLLDGVGSFASPFSSMGSTSFPQGRNVTQPEFIDNLTWLKGAHQLKFGANFRREIINDWDPGAGNTPSTTAGDVSEYMFGAASAAGIKFPISGVEPLRLFNLDMWATDTFQITPKLTFVYGLRATHNSQMKNPYGTFADVSDWTQFPHGIAAINGPQDGIVHGSNKYWNSVPFEIWQPRLSLSYQPMSNTLIKAGWGMFSQVVTPSSADTLLELPPYDPAFIGGMGATGSGFFGGSVGCGDFVPQSAQAGILTQCYSLLDPQQSLSALNGARSTYAPYLTNYNAGNPSCNAYAINKQASPPTCVPVGSLTAFPASGLQAPMVYQYSVTAERAYGKNFSAQIGYVGNRSTHISYTVDPNAYQSVCSGCFAPYQFAGATNGTVVNTGLSGCALQTPTTCSPDPRFTTFNQAEYAGKSRYDSVQAAITKRMSHGMTYQVNYTWSHCLQTNTPFTLTSGTTQSYRDCPIDIRNVINGRYTYSLPFHTNNNALGKVINDWQVSGITFFQSGQPIFLGAASNGELVQTPSTSPITAAIPIAGASPYAKGQWLSGITQAGTAGQWLNPFAFASVWDSSTKSCYSPNGAAPTLSAPVAGVEGVTPALCQFPQTFSETVRGPLFNWTDFYATKTVKITERVSFRFDAQFYNVFNHPNFAPPSFTGPIFQGSAAQTSTLQTGAITGDTAPTTGLLGSELGGNTAPRMVAFQGKIVF